LSQDTRIDGVKIDVQGMELDVLNGMRNILIERQPKLIVELHSGVDRTSLRRLLGSIGYSDGVAIEAGLSKANEDYLDNQSYVFLPSEAA